jgi:hypothetical protein
MRTDIPRSIALTGAYFYAHTPMFRPSENRVRPYGAKQAVVGQSDLASNSGLYYAQGHIGLNRALVFISMGLYGVTSAYSFICICNIN